MHEYYPLIVVGAILGVVSIIFVLAYLRIRGQKEAIGFDRNMSDGEIVKRLLSYAKPHEKSFALVLLIMLFSISYDIISPIIMGNIVELIKGDFKPSDLFLTVALYASVLLVSLVSTFFQAIILQRKGQMIFSAVEYSGLGLCIIKLLFSL